MRYLLDLVRRRLDFILISQDFLVVLTILILVLFYHRLSELGKLEIVTAASAILIYLVIDTGFDWPRLVFDFDFRRIFLIRFWLGISETADLAHITEVK